MSNIVNDNINFITQVSKDLYNNSLQMAKPKIHNNHIIVQDILFEKSRK